MTRFQQTLRRVGVVAATLLIGAGGAVAVGAPASADPVEPFSITLTGAAGCTDDGARNITWTVVNNNPELKARITWVGDGTNSHTPEDPKKVGDIAKGNDLAAGATVSGEEVIAEDDTREVAKLVVGVSWNADHAFQTFTDVQLAGLESCAPPCVTADTAEYVHTFDAAAGTATVALKGKGALCADEKGQPFSLASYFTTSGSYALPQYLLASDTKAITPTESSIELEVALPDCYRQVDLVWGDEVINPLTEDSGAYGDRKLGSDGAPGNRSEGPQGWFNGGDGECAQPDVIFEPECAGTRVILVNDTPFDDETGSFDLTFTVTGIEGEIVVPAGKSVEKFVPAEVATAIEVKKGDKLVKSYEWTRPEKCEAPTAEFASSCDAFLVKLTNPEGNTPVTAIVTSGGETGKIKVAAGAEDVYEIPTDAGEVSVTFEGFPETFTGTYAEPADCAAGGGGGGGLPVTGPQAGAMAGGAALLLGAGAVLFVMARRRRITFAA